MAYSMAQALELTAEPRIICHSAFPNNILYANKAWTQLTGFEQHEIEGRALRSIYDSSRDLDVFYQVLAKVESLVPAKVEMIHYKKDGSSFSCSVFVAPIMSSNDFGDYILTHLVITLKPPPHRPSPDEIELIATTLQQKAFI